MSKNQFYIIEHHFKEGTADNWWSEISKVLGDPAANQAMTDGHHRLGWHNHSFMPTAKARQYPSTHHQ